MNWLYEPGSYEPKLELKEIEMMSLPVTVGGGKNAFKIILYN